MMQLHKYRCDEESRARCLLAVVVTQYMTVGGLQSRS